MRYAVAATVGVVVSVEPSKLTVTVKLAVAVFPAASVAVHITAVIPIGKLEPVGGVQVG